MAYDCLVHLHRTVTTALKMSARPNPGVTYVILSYDEKTFSFDRRCSDDKVYKRMWVLCYDEGRRPKLEGNCHLTVKRLVHRVMYRCITKFFKRLNKLA